MPREERCVLCESKNVRFVTESDGDVISGPHLGAKVHKGDLVCFTCFRDDMCADAGGNFILIHERFFIHD